MTLYIDEIRLLKDSEGRLQRHPKDLLLDNVHNIWGRPLISNLSHYYHIVTEIAGGFDRGDSSYASVNLKNDWPVSGVGGDYRLNYVEVGGGYETEAVWQPDDYYGWDGDSLGCSWQKTTNTYTGRVDTWDYKQLTNILLSAHWEPNPSGIRNIGYRLKQKRILGEAYASYTERPGTGTDSFPGSVTLNCRLTIHKLLNHRPNEAMGEIVSQHTISVTLPKLGWSSYVDEWGKLWWTSAGYRTPRIYDPVIGYWNDFGTIEFEKALLCTQEVYQTYYHLP